MSNSVSSTDTMRQILLEVCKRPVFYETYSSIILSARARQMNLIYTLPPYSLEL
jgi:hypothetical protein